MDEQSRFRTVLAALSASAQKKNRKLTREEVREFFRDMELNEEQYQLVYAYLASKRIRVEGVELPKAEEQPFSAEEQAFLEQYKKDLRYVRRQEKNALEALFLAAADGEIHAKKLLAEHYMDMVLGTAREYAHQGLLLQDLVQEGNLGLLTGIDTLGLKEERLTFEEHLEQEIHRAIRSALDEQDESDNTGEQITEKLNKLADSITELTEDLGREVSPEELSLYLDMPLEELEDLLRIAGETIETAKSQEEK